MVPVSEFIISQYATTCLVFVPAGHSLAMSVWGGLSPLMISALALVVTPATLAAGVLTMILAVVSVIAAVLLIKVAPQTNASDLKPFYGCCWGNRITSSSGSLDKCNKEAVVGLA